MMVQCDAKSVQVLANIISDDSTKKKKNLIKIIRNRVALMLPLQFYLLYNVYGISEAIFSNDREWFSVSAHSFNSLIVQLSKHKSVFYYRESQRIEIESNCVF